MWGILFVLLCLPSHGQDKRKAVLDSLETVLETYDQDTNRILTLIRLGVFWHKTNNTKSSRYATEALELAKKLDFWKGEYRATNLLGTQDIIAGDYTAALNHFLSCLPKAEQLNDKEALALLNANIGMMQMERGEHEESDRYITRALKIVEAEKDDVKMLKRAATIYNNRGLRYRRMEPPDYEKAIFNMEKALHIYDSLKVERKIAMVYNNMALIYMDKRDYSEAIRLINKALVLKQKTNDLFGMANSMHNLVEIYIKLKDHPSASSLLQKSLALAEQINAKRLIGNAYALATTLDSAQNDYKSAFQHLRTHHRIIDELQGEQKARQIEELRIQYETEKKERENIVLKQLNQIQEQENQLQQQEIQLREKEVDEQQRTLVLVIVSLALILVFSIILVFQVRAKSKTNRLLEAANDKIQAINDQLEQKVEERTKKLAERNAQLLEYAYLNSHQVRGPLAKILGLVNLAKMDDMEGEQAKMMLDHIQDSAKELDDVIHQINQNLEKVKEE